MEGQPTRKPLPAKLDTAQAECRLFVLGDANMIRDDHLDPRNNPLGQFGTTYWNQGGGVVFNNIVDWMALDLDLVELRTRRSKDRKLDFASEVFGEKETPEQRKARAATTKAFLKWGNTLFPVLVLLGYGVFTLVRRSAEKRAFLSSSDAA